MEGSTELPSKVLWLLNVRDVPKNLAEKKPGWLCLLSAAAAGLLPGMPSGSIDKPIEFRPTALLLHTVQTRAKTFGSQGKR